MRNRYSPIFLKPFYFGISLLKLLSPITNQRTGAQYILVCEWMDAWINKRIKKRSAHIREWPVANCSSAWHNTCLILLMASLVFLAEKEPGKSLGKRGRTCASEVGHQGVKRWLCYRFTLCVMSGSTPQGPALWKLRREFSSVRSSVEIAWAGGVQGLYQMTIKDTWWLYPAMTKFLKKFVVFCWMCNQLHL